MSRETRMRRESSSSSWSSSLSICERSSVRLSVVIDSSRITRLRMI